MKDHLRRTPFVLGRMFYRPPAPAIFFQSFLTEVGDLDSGATLRVRRKRSRAPEHLLPGTIITNASMRPFLSEMILASLSDSASFILSYALPSTASNVNCPCVWPSVLARGWLGTSSWSTTILNVASFSTCRVYWIF